MNTCSVINIFFLLFLSVGVFSQMPGGYSNMDKDTEDFHDLATELQESNLSGVMNGQATVKRVEEAQKQIVAGTNYRILGEVEVDGQSQSCCFQAFKSLKGDFSVNCVDCGCDYPSSECFQ